MREFNGHWMKKQKLISMHSTTLNLVKNFQSHSVSEEEVKTENVLLKIVLYVHLKCIQNRVQTIFFTTSHRKPKM